MRERTTWKSGGPRQAATSRRADIYEMNQDRKQPSATEYESGNPDSWAETPVDGSKMSVNDEYEGEKVKRNELGMGEFRDDTWKHKDADEWNGKGKYDNAKVAAERKALAAERVARAALRTGNDKLVTAAALELMSLPNGRLAALMKHLDAVSPDALSEDSKLRRAFACTKLAARTLGDNADEPSVERLARTYMRIDDPTLKSILKIVASVRVAEDDGQGSGDKPEEKAASEKKDDDSDDQGQGQGQAEPPAVAASEKKEEEVGAPVETQSQELTPEEHNMLHEMLEAAPAAPAIMAPPAVLAPAAAVAPPADDLTSLFEVTSAPAPAAMVASSDISFDDDDAGEVNVAASDIDGLFADDPEVQAQRAIQTASHDGGFTSVGRTASTGAKKLGTVTKAKPVSPDAALEQLWDRP